MSAPQQKASADRKEKRGAGRREWGKKQTPKGQRVARGAHITAPGRSLKVPGEVNGHGRDQTEEAERARGRARETWAAVGKKDRTHLFQRPLCTGRKRTGRGG